MKEPSERLKNTNTAEALKRKNSFRGWGVLLPITAVVVALAVLASFSWFGRIRESDSAGSVVSDDYRLFELGAITNGAGTSRNVAVADNVLDLLSGYGAQVYGRNILETSELKDGVMCALEPDGGGAIRPGSHGTLRFRILPRTSNHDYYTEFFLNGIKKVVSNLDSSVSYELMDRNVPSDDLALDFLEGHVLFFSDSSHTHRVDSGDVLLIEDADTAGEEYIVTLYWVWPRTFSDHSAYVDASWQASHNYLEAGVGDIGYNNADQIIGERISYVVVELDVTGTIVDTGATQHVVETTLLND